MKSLIHVTLLITLGFSAFSQSYKQPPHLERRGNAVQLVVRDKPFLVLGGELHNSTVSGAANMRPVWAQLKKKHLNTVLAPVYWELMEPEEGRFNFALVDSMIAGARKQNLHLALLWFGAFKTTYSTYVPSWVKTNPAKYPRVKTDKGESLPLLSVFSENNLRANANAFRVLMQHIRQVDARQQTVIMVQVENEVGLFNMARDHSNEANTAYSQGVPADMTRYLAANKGKLQPELDSIWQANGAKTSGSWEAVFGPNVLDEKNPRVLSNLADELFTAYHYTNYVGRLAAAGKEAYPLPMFVNAWPKMPGFTGVPGKYPSGGPVPHLLDVWRANAPSIDFITPNVYAPKPGVYALAEQYHRSGNPLFIPEIRSGLEPANLALWLYGQHDAMGVAPFGIDGNPNEEDPFTHTFAVLEQMQEMVLAHQGKGTMAGVFVDSTAKTQTFTLNNYAVKANLVTPRRFPGGPPPPKGPPLAGGLIIATGPDEFLAVGKDYELTFTPLTPDPQKPHLDVDYMDEGTFEKGKWITTRRLNGDEGTGGGSIGSFAVKDLRTGALRFQNDGSGSFRIVKIRFYRY